jgi:prolyl oligopeptidase
VAWTSSPVAEEYHGTLVVDRYRWLENSDSPNVRDWTIAQNDLTRTFLDTLPDRLDLHEELNRLTQLGEQGAPLVRTLSSGTLRYFHFKRTGSQEIRFSGSAMVLVRTCH